MAQDSSKIATNGEPPKPDDAGADEIDRTKAPLIEHLAELRRRLFWAVVAFFAMFILCFAFSKPIYNILLVPYQDAATNNTLFDPLIRLFDSSHGVKTQPVAPIEMIFTAPQEFFFTQMKLAMFGALFLAFPIIATQIYMFVAPGLYRDERKAFLPYLVATPLLFLLGAGVVYFIAMPLAMKFFLSMQQIGGEGEVAITLSARVSEYLGLITTLILGFGIIFQLPVILMLLARIGIINSQFLRDKRRYAILGIVAVAAILTPPDPISQIGMALPTILLYEASIKAVEWAEKRRAAAEANAG